MTGSGKLAIALSLFCGIYASAHAQSKYGESRGELLYMTHCNACHTTEIHWREQKLATGWSGLVAQVRRWQASIGLNWSEEEIADVAHYLNMLHYGFPIPGQKGLSQDRKLIHALRQDSD